MTFNGLKITFQQL